MPATGNARLWQAACAVGLHLRAMLQQILMGAALVGATVVIQARFVLVGLRAPESCGTAERRFAHHHATLIIVLFVLFMFLAIIIDVWLWATVYLVLGAIASFEEALYFSPTSFTTLGYGDVVLTPEWRLRSFPEILQNGCARDSRSPLSDEFPERRHVHQLNFALLRFQQPVTL